jgi:redox-sensing transcriptional repressor
VSELHIPAATVARLPLYLQVLRGAAETGIITLSSDDLARGAGVNSAKVRKDLSHLGSHGTRGVGYDVTELTARISAVLGLTDDRAVVIVGIGNLGRALASYGGFTRRGFTVGALVDADPAIVGTAVGDQLVRPIDELPTLVRERGLSIGVLAVPAAAAQQVADTLVAAGVTALLNFAPTHLDVPDGVAVRRVDLSIELQILAFYERAGDTAGDDEVAATG